jgi:hypothetical protein
VRNICDTRMTSPTHYSRRRRASPENHDLT